MKKNIFPVLFILLAGHTLLSGQTGRQSTGILCTDSLCNRVKVVTYYKLGGHAFAGLFPINNPENTGDTGIASLYMLNNHEAALVDSDVFVYLGYYSFPHVPEGNYIIKVALTPKSEHYPMYSATWYPDAVQQSEAVTVILSDTDMYDADIHLHPADQGIRENSSYAGMITAGDPFPDPASDVISMNVESIADQTIRVEVVSVIGRKIISRNYSVDAGVNSCRIQVGSLPAGMYYIKAGTDKGNDYLVRKFIKK